MNDKKTYAHQWKVSSKHFYENDYYKWMTLQISQFKTVLELGCGAGYSTLSLLKEGHKVIAIDKNDECISIAKNRIVEAGFSVGNDSNSDVIFIVADFVNTDFYEKYLSGLSFDVVLCWNVGTHDGFDVRKHYHPFLLEYGLNEYQIIQNWESSYAELILWKACLLASKCAVPCHIIDRSQEGLNESNNDYYSSLGSECKYTKMMVNNLPATSISLGGRTLISNGKPIKERTISTVLISVLYFN